MADVLVIIFVETLAARQPINNNRMTVDFDYIVDTHFSEDVISNPYKDCKIYKYIASQTDISLFSVI